MIINFNISKKIMAIILSLLFVVGLVCVTYFYIWPHFTTEYMQKGVDSAIINIIGQLNTKGYVTLVVGNQTINLVPYTGG